MLEEQVPEERDIYLNEEEDIIMEDSSQEQWRYFPKEVQDKSNIHAMRWDVKMRKDVVACVQDLVWKKKLVVQFKYGENKDVSSCSLVF